jgi:hypothetical protein
MYDYRILPDLAFGQFRLKNFCLFFIDWLGNPASRISTKYLKSTTTDLQGVTN